MRYDPITRTFRAYEGGGKGNDGQQAAATDWANTQQGWQQTTAANRPNIETPWGKQTWTQDGDNWTQNISLSPEQQNALDSQQNITQGRSNAAEGLLGQATEAFNKPMDWGSFESSKNLQDVGYDPNGARDRSERALFDRQVSKLEPGLTQSEDARRTRLANMGIAPEGGSAAWARAQTSMDSKRNQAYQDAAWQSVIGGGQEAQREFGLASGAAGFSNQLRQQQISEEAQRRGMTLNELNALLTGQQVQMPGGLQQNTNSTANAMGGSDFLGGAKLDAESGMDWGSLIGAGAKAGMMMSDIRLKRNIKALGRGWYEFNYVWGGPRQIGMMAQEVMLTNPAAVHVHPSGYLMIDYGRV